MDLRIENTYAKFSRSKNKNPLYDSYIRAFRWASDRIGDEGVIGFVTNANWIDGTVTDGMRKCFYDEFSKIFIFHLRGNQRTSGEVSRKEGGKIFGSGSRAPIAITILVKKQKNKDDCEIFLHDIGDYLDRNKKLDRVKTFKSVSNMKNARKFISITPDEENDWLNQTDKNFQKLLPLKSKTDDKGIEIFKIASSGVSTQRDAWCYNFSKNKLSQNISGSITYFNSHQNEVRQKFNRNETLQPEKLIDRNSKRFSWDSKLDRLFAKFEPLNFNPENIQLALYRPFTKAWIYRDPHLNWSEYKMRQIFPNADASNIVLMTSGIGGTKGFSLLASRQIVDRNIMPAGVQCYPLRVYEQETKDDSLFSNTKDIGEFSSSSGIHHFAKDKINSLLSNRDLSDKEFLAYIYAVCHSTEYQTRFANNLIKETPRIPVSKDTKIIEKYVQAGLVMMDLHLDFDEVKKYECQIKEGDLQLTHIEDPKSFFRVEKMKFAKKGDKSTVIYNKNVTIENIPLEAYEYVVNGKPALEWVMERQCVKTDKASGIVNDANDYANETMNNPAYPLELFQRVITVSLETMKIVKSLPKLDID